MSTLPEFTDVTQFLAGPATVALSPDPEADRKRRDAARARYEQAEEALAEQLEALYRTIEPAQRAGLLRAMRDQATVQAETHEAAFGPTPVDGANEAGATDMTGALTLTAVVLNALAGVEATRAGQGPRPKVDHPAAELIERHVGALLDQMSDPDLDVEDLHTLMCGDLYDALVEVVGEDAAEVLITIADTVPQRDKHGRLLTALDEAPPRRGTVSAWLVFVPVVLAAVAATSGHLLAAAVIMLIAGAVTFVSWLARR